MKPVVEQLETRTQPAPLHSHVSIAVLNYATLISPEEVQAAIAAVQIQVSRDVKKFWNKDATFRFIDNWDQLVGHEQVVLIGDDWDGGFGALAWHDYQGGHPVSFIPWVRFLVVQQVYGINFPWTLGLSHEVLEMLLDPNTRNLRVYDVHNLFGSSEALVFREIADPVEANTYTINGVVVSDFVLPRWYNSFAGRSQKTDFLGALHRPLWGAPGGFFEYWDVPTDTLVEVDF